MNYPHTHTNRERVEEKGGGDSYTYNDSSKRNILQRFTHTHTDK